MAIHSLEKWPPTALPRAIRRGLVRVDHRLRAVGAARGLGKAALLLSVVAAAAMAVDVAFVLPIEVRWTIWGIWIAAGTIALLRCVVRPMVRRMTWNDLAAVAESGETTLGERLTSAVGLLRQQPHGSPVLIAALVDDATERVRKANLTGAISSRTAVSSLFLGLAAMALVVVPAFVQPHPYRNLWKRFLAPWADIDRVGRFAIGVSPGDKVVAIGADLPVSATVRSRFGETTPRADAWLEWTVAAGSTNRVKMVAAQIGTASEPTFAVTLPKLTESLSYRIIFGSDTSRLHQIKAIEAPAVTSLKAYIEPPSYTKRPGAPARDPLRLDAWEDSRITWDLEGSRPLKQVELIWPAPETNGKSSTGEALSRTVSLHRAADGRRWTTTVVAGVSGPFAFTLRDDFDLESPPAAPHRLTVRPDAPPTLAVATPSDLKETRSDDLLMVAIVAHDDVAVASAELHYTIERSTGSTGPALGHTTAPLTGLGTPSARGEAAISLKTLSLRPGDLISYQVRVADNRPAPRGPNVAWSATYGLRIIEHSESLLARQGSAEREALRARLEVIRKNTQTNRQETEKLRVAADAVRSGNGTWDDRKAKLLVDAEASAHGVSDQLQVLARDLAEHPTFQPLARPARQLAEVETEAARATLDAARRTGDAAKRLHELQQSKVRLTAVTVKIDELIRKFGELARRDDDRRRLRLLAERQNDLADQVDSAGKIADSGALDPLLAEQERLRRQLDELLKNSPALRTEALNAQAREADDLAARARALAAQQREEGRRTSNDEQRRSALKALADQERALEDDARRLALVVNEPLAQNGRGRVDVDALTRTIETIERGDVDQARERSREAENALNRLTVELEDVRNDPKALARRLAQRQEALRHETAQAVHEVRDHPPQTPEGKATLANRLKPLTVRQEAIARLAAAIPAPSDQNEVARLAAKTSAQARDDLREPRPREVEGHQSEARDALNRLADALPDPNQRRNRAREKLAEARSWSEEVARDLETHLRETAPKSGQQYDPGRAAADLAQRVTPLARRQREIALALAAIDPEPRAIPQRDRAARRALALAAAIENLRQPRFERLREALPALRVAAKASLDRLQQKLDGHQPADELADDLAHDQRDLKASQSQTPPADPVTRAQAAADQRRLANALHNLDAPDAPVAKADAIHRAEQAAKALEAPEKDHKTPDVNEALARASAATESLANRLNDRQSHRQRVLALSAAQRALGTPDTADPGEQARLQRAIADELASLPAEGKGEAAETVAHAAELADQAGRIDNAAAPNPVAIAKARDEAAVALDRLAKTLGNELEPRGKNEADLAEDPDLGLNPLQVAEAAALARRQRHIRQGLQAILGEGIDPQRALRASSTALGHEVAELRERSHETSSRAQGPAHAAVDLLGRAAPETMDRAIEGLHQGRPGETLQAQRHAADRTEQAARHVEDMAASLRADRPADTRENSPGELAAALAAQREAGQHLSQAGTPSHSPAAASQATLAAATAMRKAAQGLRAASQTTQEFSLPRGPTHSQIGASPQDSRTLSSQSETTDLSRVKAALRTKTGRAWGELPGHLRTEILQMSQGRYRDEYARLIELYFREIAADASTRGAKP
jgi:hypothetical protein